MTGSSALNAACQPTGSAARGKASSASAPPARASRAISGVDAPATTTRSGRAARQTSSTVRRWASVRCGPRPVWAHTATPATPCPAIHRAYLCWAAAATAEPWNGTGTAGMSPPSRRAISDIGSARRQGTRVVRLDQRALLRRQVEEIELGYGVLREAQRLPRTEHEPLDADRRQHGRQVILGWTPQPADDPRDAPRLFGRRAERHFFHQTAIRVGDDEPQILAAANQGAQRRRGQLSGHVVGVTLPPVLQPDRHEERH